MTGLLSEQLYISQFALMLVAAISALASCPGDSPPHGRSLCASWPSCCSGIWRCWIWSVIVHIQTYSDTFRHIQTLYTYYTYMCLVQCRVSCKTVYLMTSARVNKDTPGGCWDPLGRSAAASWSASSCWEWRGGSSSGSCWTRCSYCSSREGRRSPWSCTAAWRTVLGWPPRSWSGRRRSWPDICSGLACRSAWTQICGPTRSL